MSVLFEWRIRDIEQKADRAVSRLYEIDSLNSNVDSLERSVRELRSENDRLLSELQECMRRIEQIESINSENNQ